MSSGSYRARKSVSGKAPVMIKGKQKNPKTTKKAHDTPQNPLKQSTLSFLPSANRNKQKGNFIHDLSSFAGRMKELSGFDLLSSTITDQMRSALVRARRWKNNRPYYDVGNAFLAADMESVVSGCWENKDLRKMLGESCIFI